MSIGDLFSAGALIAGLVAAIYAALAYHRPRPAKKDAPPCFIGSLPNDAEKLVEFLIRHEGALVELDIELSAGPASDDGTLISHWDKTNGRFTERLRLPVGQAEGDAIAAYEYQILGDRDGHGAVGRVMGLLVLRGAFIPRSFLGAYSGVAYGSLTPVDPVRRALLMS